MSQQDGAIEMLPIPLGARRPSIDSIERLRARDAIAEIKTQLYVNKVKRVFRRIGVYHPVVWVLVGGFAIAGACCIMWKYSFRSTLYVFPVVNV